MLPGLSSEVHRLLAAIGGDERCRNRRLQGKVRRLFHLLYGPFDDFSYFLRWREGLQ